MIDSFDYYCLLPFMKIGFVYWYMTLKVSGETWCLVIYISHAH